MEVLAQIFTSWPAPVAVIVIVALSLFRKPLIGFIERAHHVKGPGVEVTAAKQDETKSVATTEAVAPITAVAMPQPLIKFDSVLVRRVAEGLKQQVDSQFGDNPSQREKYLIDIAADAIAATAYEYIYSLIYGSQLVALRDLNSAGVVPIADLNPYFETAKQTYPTLYQNDTFERWFGWLAEVTMLVERRDTESVVVSEVGRDFLQFVISRGYAFSKNG